MKKQPFIVIILVTLLIGVLTACAPKEPEHISGGWWGTVVSNDVKEDGNRVIHILLSDIDTDGKYFILKPDTHIESNLSVEQILPGDYIRMNVLDGIRTEEGIVCIEVIIHPRWGQD